MPLNRFGEYFHKRKLKHVVVKTDLFFETCLNIPCTRSTTTYTFPLHSGTIVDYQKLNTDGLVQVLVNNQSSELNGTLLKRGDVITIRKGGEDICFIILTVKCPVLP